MARKPIPPHVQADVVIKSKRRCALCYGLNDNLDERPGQIAHLNNDNTDARFENLVWLCLEHHDKYDSRTSQTKNYTLQEVRSYRDQLYKYYSHSEYSAEDISLVRDYLRNYSEMFQYLFQEYSELAFSINHFILEDLASVRDFWHTNSLRSFNTSIRDIQDRIAHNIVGICAIYEINMYDLVGNSIRYDSQRFGREILEKKRLVAKQHVDEIENYYKQLEEIATMKI